MLAIHRSGGSFAAPDIETICHMKLESAAVAEGSC